MYSKMTSEKDRIELPPNYGGSVFGRREGTPRFMPPQGMAARRPVREYAPPAVVSEVREFTECESHKPQVPIEENNSCDQHKNQAPCCEIPSCKAEGECDKDRDKCRSTEDTERRESEKKTSLFPSLSSIGTEELLLIAIALMVFQGGKEPDLALILLALLFIN